MIKCKDNGPYTCISRNGKPKSRWDTAALVKMLSISMRNTHPRPQNWLGINAQIVVITI